MNIHIFYRAIVFLSLFSMMAAAAESGMVFVKEYCSHTKDFRTDPTPVSSLDIGPCLLLEMFNEENGKRTVFSLSHFTHAMVNDQNSLEISVKKIVDEFKKMGGSFDVNRKFAVRIYGGSEMREHRRHNRTQLKNAVYKQVGKNLKIEVPKNHWKAKKDTVIDYIFYAEKMEFVKYSSSGLHEDVCSVGASESTIHPKINRHYWPVSRILDEQTDRVIQRINLGMEAPVINLVGRDGLIANF